MGWVLHGRALWRRLARGNSSRAEASPGLDQPRVWSRQDCKAPHLSASPGIAKPCPGWPHPAAIPPPEDGLGCRATAEPEVLTGDSITLLLRCHKYPVQIVFVGELQEQEVGWMVFCVCHPSAPPLGLSALQKHGHLLWPCDQIPDFHLDFLCGPWAMGLCVFEPPLWFKHL